MSYTIRVSLSGINALEATPDARDYSLLADDDNILIKEEGRGSVDVAEFTWEEIDHDIGYCPHFYIYGEVSSGRYQLVNGYNIFGNFLGYTGISTLYLKNGMCGDSRKIRYYVFYDDIPEV
jgi:hypothetical protein